MRKLFIVLGIIGLLTGKVFAWDSSTDLTTHTVAADLVQIQDCLQSIDGTSGTPPTKVIANTNIGIGTTAPLGIFEAKSGASSRLVILGTGNVGIGLTNPLGRFQVGTTPGTPLLIIKDSGNVGIGTSNPTANLYVAGSLFSTVGTYNTATATTLKFGAQTNTLPAGTGAAGQLLVTNGSGGWVYGGGIPGTIYTTAGVWTRPSTVDKVWVKCWGAGAGGNGNPGTGTGGGGGGYAEGIVTVTGNVTVTVGTGGAAGGNAGGTSSFGTDIICNGGTLGVGGTCSGGNLRISGGVGGEPPQGDGGGSPMGGAGGPGATSGAARAGCAPGGGGGGGNDSPAWVGGAGADGLVIVYY